ncbi:hypothetical protein PIROE2DRAFT_69261 [Piromyces sp. E2]|nr:hypothetical protein PIROE2DRAFT_69261 [Piromyces sp. E2]|eukprot:OUM64310.1 hypothetical protein PIROE2DRAFT_69261 [Piromyces sp. E2]
MVENIVLTRLAYAIKQYINEYKANTPEKYYFEKRIIYWFKIFEPKCNFEYNPEEHGINDVVALNHINIFFCTLKIVFYRHQSTSFVLSGSKKNKFKALNTPEGIGYSFTKYESKEREKIDMLFECCLNFVNKWHEKEVKEKNKKKKKVPSLYDDHPQDNNSYVRMDNKTKERKTENIKIDYNLKLNKSKNGLNINDFNKSKNSNEKKEDTKILKRSHSQSFTKDTDDALSNTKKRKIITSLNLDSKNETRSSSNNLQNLKKILMKNKIGNKFINIKDIIREPKNKSNKDNDKDNEDEDEEIMNNDEVFNKNFNDFINNNKSIYFNYHQKNHSYESLDNVLNPLDNSKPNTLIEKYFDLKDNNLSEINSLQDNPINMLKKCLSIANTVTKKVKIMIQCLNQNKMIFNFLLSWCFYEIGVVYLIFYVDEGKYEYLENAKYYRDLLIQASKPYLASIPYLSNYNEMLQEAEASVKNNTKKLVIKDFF